jgi:oligoribonuclease NrnB/cAMP/cGMP phosphodiesterase (DHH superfamily)
MKVLVIHHDDQDGRMGGYIMVRYYKEQGYEVQSFEADYNTKFDFGSMVENGDKVCIVDYSLNNEVM